jgi:TrmH family RNA methyltransferase
MLVIEGEQELEYALRAGYPLEYLLYPIGQEPSQYLIDRAKHSAEMETSLFKKLTYRGESARVAAILGFMDNDVEGRSFNKVLVLENIEKPGNLGALFRTALASACDAIITTGQSTDFYNSNCIRSSVGTVFLLPHWRMDNDEALSFLKKQDLQIYATDLEGSKSLYAEALPERAAFVFGAEHQGISDFWKNKSAHKIRIPMAADMDSLNLSASAAVVLYEHSRQHPKSYEE